jgi:hypothetical protein
MVQSLKKIALPQEKIERAGHYLAVQLTRLPTF